MINNDLRQENSRQAKRRAVAESWLRCTGITETELQTIKQDEYISVWQFNTNNILVIADEAHFETNNQVAPDDEGIITVTDESGSKYRLCWMSAEDEMQEETDEDTEII
jgi:hypothetical protein